MMLYAYILCYSTLHQSSTLPYVCTVLYSLYMLLMLRPAQVCLKSGLAAPPTHPAPDLAGARRHMGRGGSFCGTSGGG